MSFKNKYITVDSGERSQRKEYIRALLKHYNFTLGRPTIALSQVNPQNTRNFLLILPRKLRAKILSIGHYHTFISITEHTRSIIELLYLDDSNREYINQLIDFIQNLTLKLVDQLNKEGIFVILDRSVLTNYAYTSVLNTHRPTLVDDLIKRGATLQQKGIFIESSLTPSSTDADEFYDILGTQFNIRLANWYNTLALKSTNICIVSASDSFSDGMKKILSFLQ